MATEVSICNTALGYIGDAALVTSINPPDGSAQASYCAQYYPIARDAMIEAHPWAFSTKRAALTLAATNDSSTWLYAYVQPTDMLNTLAVLDPAATDDYSSPIFNGSTFYSATSQYTGGVNTPQEYAQEVAQDGTQVIYTNQANAVLRYTFRATDVTTFSSLFVKALGGALAALLAGPVIKGREGTAVARQWDEIAYGRDGKSGWFGAAAASDAAQRKSTLRDRQQVAWINGR